MFRLTWGRLGGSVIRRRTVAPASSSAAVLMSGRTTRARSVQSRTASNPVRRASRGISATRTKLSRRSKSPAAVKHKASASDNSAGRRKGAPTAADQASASTPLSTAKVDETKRYASARPDYMSAEREKEVLAMAERMQRRDLTTEVPVASFAYEILKAHPSVRNMGLRERMDFLLNRWDRLKQSKKLEYINDPLRGLL
ncbi:putative mitochondrial hypothetical protein [Leptomonas pyrrhocoris]|uniref:Uncharacterized protein n=1 Tax=Leptomonas pyrrhocoris TaxID=157538 RepID=A0A0N0DY89_LEPPY|nr:putative mitochondrial hypothetical protein [Leptomonas pyrrhocoris]KPA83868.1 putative mitochondrial hypothetical protein [Leptomonas pyrrhocoris]|eukprot:XP_015662307.1 putative mitochondrial hypothetical protein [Leptomonas pyrrhocoris]